MFLLLSNFALGHLPLRRKPAHALKNVAVPDHCLTAGCHLSLSKTHLLPLLLQISGLDFKQQFLPTVFPALNLLSGIAGK